MTQTLMKALSDLKEPNKPSRPRSRIESNVSTSSNKDRKSRIMDRDDLGSQRSERKNNNITKMAKKEGLRSRITNWWSLGKNNEGKKKDKNQPTSNKALYKPTIMRNKELEKTKEEIQKKYEHYYNKWRDYDLLTSILLMLGLVVAIADREFILAMEPTKTIDYQDSYVRMIITITSLLASKIIFLNLFSHH